jgi:hypothetical protein
MGAVTPDLVEGAAPAGQHAVPVEQHLVRARRGERAVEMDHHLGDSLFSRHDASVMGGEPELLADRGLHACPIENLPLDLRCSHCLHAQGFDDELGAVGVIEMSDCADERPATDQELLFRSRQAVLLPGEFGPVGPLPVPLLEW